MGGGGDDMCASTPLGGRGVPFPPQSPLAPLFAAVDVAQAHLEAEVEAKSPGRAVGNKESSAVQRFWQPPPGGDSASGGQASSSSSSSSSSSASSRPLPMIVNGMGAGVGAGVGAPAPLSIPRPVRRRKPPKMGGLMGYAATPKKDRGTPRAERFVGKDREPPGEADPRLPPFEFSEESLAQQRVALNALTPAVRRWCMYEWFYANIDYHYLRHNEFKECLAALGLDGVGALTRVEWSYIRGAIGRPRRFSPRFVAEERAKLHAYRQQVRRIAMSQPSGAPPEVLSAPGLPDVPARLVIGDRVTARHPHTRHMHCGYVLAADHDSYWIHFDYPELGVQAVPDTGVMSHELLCDTLKRNDLEGLMLYRNNATHSSAGGSAPGAAPVSLATNAGAVVEASSSSSSSCSLGGTECDGTTTDAAAAMEGTDPNAGGSKTTPSGTTASSSAFSLSSSTSSSSTSSTSSCNSSIPPGTQSNVDPTSAAASSSSSSSLAEAVPDRQSRPGAPFLQSYAGGVFPSSDGPGVPPFAESSPWRKRLRGDDGKPRPPPTEADAPGDLGIDVRAVALLQRLLERKEALVTELSRLNRIAVALAETSQDAAAAQSQRVPVSDAFKRHYAWVVLQVRAVDEAISPIVAEVRSSLPPGDPESLIRPDTTAATATASTTTTTASDDSDTNISASVQRASDTDTAAAMDVSPTAAESSPLPGKKPGRRVPSAPKGPPPPLPPTAWTPRLRDLCRDTARLLVESLRGRLLEKYQQVVLEIPGSNENQNGTADADPQETFSREAMEMTELVSACVSLLLHVQARSERKVEAGQVREHLDRSMALLRPLTAANMSTFHDMQAYAKEIVSTLEAAVAKAK